LEGLGYRIYKDLHMASVGVYQDRYALALAGDAYLKLAVRGRDPYLHGSILARNHNRYPGGLFFFWHRIKPAFPLKNARP
jgi:hypothetical protein